MTAPNFVPPTREPILLIANTSDLQVTILDKLVLQPGETAEVFGRIQPEARDDMIIRAVRGLTPPEGQLYIDWKIRGIIQVLDFRIWAYSVDETLLRTDGQPFDGAILGFVDGKLDWVTGSGLAIEAPLEYVGGKLTLPQASASADGFLSKEDYQYIFSSIRRRQKIWQYQDFSPPIGTSLTLSAFQNGTGLTFDAGFIVSDTAAIVQAADNDKPPTSTLSFPARLLPSSRVKVDSHIGDTVILNQSPDASTVCRVYFLISLPEGSVTPNDYHEAPMFLRGPSDALDEMYVNQAQDESVYGAKVYTGSARFEGALQITNGAQPGYVLTSVDGAGIATWQPPTGGGGGDGYSDFIRVQETKPLDGYLWIVPSSAQGYIYSTSTGMWLAEPHYIDYFGGQSTVDGMFLRTHDTVASSKSPAVISAQAVIDEIQMSAATATAHTVDLIINGISAGQYGVSTSAVTPLSVLVPAGCTVAIKITGGLSEYPILKIRYRYAL